MKRANIIIIAIAFIFVSIAPASALVMDFSATLEGSQEVPPNMSPASGSLSATLTGDFGSNNFVLAYEVSYADLLGTLTAAHIHNAPVGVNGPVEHFLDNVPFGTMSGSFVGDWRFDDPLSLTEVFAQEMISGNMYVNIHSQVFPGGEIRGQLTLVPEPASIVLMCAGLAGAGLLRKRFKN